MRLSSTGLRQANTHRQVVNIIALNVRIGALRIAVGIVAPGFAAFAVMLLCSRVALLRA